jgi:pseudouridine synthase
VASRRAADELIASGKVLVNGKRPPPSGSLIDPLQDRVTVDGRPVKPVTSHRYVVLNKPLGAITTAKDEASRTTVLDVIGKRGAHGHRLFPVGRLDADSTGLLLLTDDGDLAYRLTHPRYKVAKEYLATVAGVPGPPDLEALRSGVKLDDGMTAPAEVEVIRVTTADHDSGRAVLRVVIREGRQRQVRRMLQAVGHRVQSLRRTAFGPLKLARLKVGEWRELDEREVAALRRTTGLAIR